jgi:ABC-2 type transport system ATP-binding protein
MNNEEIPVSAPVIDAKGLAKRYGTTVALDSVTFRAAPGRIVGLIGPNGAGKTTALNAILGLIPAQGSVSVLGFDPYRERDRLMEQVCFIADVAVLPRWIRVRQAVDFVAHVHPRFRPERCEQLLAQFGLPRNARVDALSKGMVTQLHLSLVMAIDAKLLVLDEPTLGLDIVSRKQFYDHLINDYMDEERTILVTTHQVEEIENILTDLLFIDRGRIVLDMSMEDIPARFAQLIAAPDQAPSARLLAPLSERNLLGRSVFIFDGADQEELAKLGEVRQPALADLFVAKMQPRSTT